MLPICYLFFTLLTEINDVFLRFVNPETSKAFKIEFDAPSKNFVKISTKILEKFVKIQKNFRKILHKFDLIFPKKKRDFSLLSISSLCFVLALSSPCPC